MEWWRILVLVLMWIAAFILLKSGLILTKESHKKKSVSDTMNLFPVSDTIAGNIAGIILGAMMGLVFKYIPWWVNKAVLLLFSTLLFCFGIWVVLNK